VGLSIPSIPQQLLETTQVCPSDVEALLRRLTDFATSFAPFFYRKEQAQFRSCTLRDSRAISIERVSNPLPLPIIALAKDFNVSPARENGRIHEFGRNFTVK